MPPVVRTQLDYYALLEITPAADVTEVNAAFRHSS
jgi:curved DNA-binding protein CbpA